MATSGSTPERSDRVRGHVAERFEPVREQFRRNFAERGELGAACAVYHRGEPVVDLRGGFRDVARTEPWTDETVVLLFSTTKGLAATAVALARSRGHLAYDDRVAEHWPAFGDGGKSAVTVRELLDHRAGLAAVDAPLTPATVDDRESLLADLASASPDWEPGNRHGYHAWSLGLYQSELVRRADPEGRALARFFADEIADPLDLDAFVGLPESVADERVAEIRGFRPLQMLRHVDEYPPRMLAAMANPWSATSRALLPLRASESPVRRALHPFAVRSPARLNESPYRSWANPSATGFARVQDVGALYGHLARDPEAVGIDRAVRDEFATPATAPPGGRQDVVLKMETSYSLGYWKPHGGFRFGSPRAFGAPGVGGAFAFADPSHDLGFAYAPNRMGAYMLNDPRERALRSAVYECIPAPDPTAW